MILDKVMSSTPRPYAMLNTTILDEFPTLNPDPDPDPDPEEVISKIQLMMQ